jgi:hypothetical protein
MVAALHLCSNGTVKRRYPLAIFLGAFLLFLVQPMAGKRVLPRFGGGPSVWTACMLFFQVLLLGGYAYAHAISSRLSRRAQAWLHCGLLLLAAASLLLFARAETWDKHGAGLDDPVLAILLVLATAVGLPYFLLASTGPLLQAWFWSDSQASLVDGGDGPSPYRLYALSNIASFLALLCYPVAVEPWLTLRTQSWMWSGIFLIYAATIAYCAVAGSGASAVPAEAATEKTGKLSVVQVIFWLALAACGSTLLLAATNHICQEVAVIPFLWIVPLAIYLLTFVLCFDSDGWYNRRAFALLAAGAIAGGCYMATRDTPPKIWLQALTDLGIVFGGCMICHGELARSKPEPARLTQFYLALSAGGALGGVFSAVVAPRIFNTFLEFPLAMSACCLLGLVAWWRDGVFSSEDSEERKSWWSRIGAGTNYIAAAALIAAATAGVTLILKKPDEKVLLATRNFFGVLRVTEDEEDGGKIHKLTHGRTLHGLQFEDAERRDLPTTYYGPESGVGLAVTLHPRRIVKEGVRLLNDVPVSHNLKIGVIGLGTGTMAAWGRKGDTIRFYDINPSVERVSRAFFTYRQDSPARVEVVLGDARVKLEEEVRRGESQQFDVLAVDAFSSDAIPAHLLTAECAMLYKYHLKPDGLLLLHISNRWLDLSPPARALAQHLGWTAALIDAEDEEGPGIRSSSWVVVTANMEFLKTDGVKSAITEWTPKDRPPLLWRDDFTSLWPVFQW